MMLYCILYICYPIFTAHPFLFMCLCMAMIMWFVTQEQMLAQVMLRMSRQQS